MTARNVTQADVERVSVSDITIGERRRKRIRNIPALAKSIEEVGLLHPIVLDADNVLVAGGRRLAACMKLGWKTVPARRVGSLAPDDLRDLELQENTQREDLDSFDASKQRLAEIRAAEEEAREEYCPDSGQKPRGRGQPRKPDSVREVAARTGLSRSEIQRVEQHVSLAEKFPTMKGRDWLKTHVLTAGEIIAKVPEPEREKLGQLVLQPGVPRKQALDALENVVSLPPPERKQLYQLHASPDPHDRAQALAKAADVPPPPDPRLALLDQAVDLLQRAEKRFSDDLAKKIRGVKNAADAIRRELDKRYQKTRGVR